MPPPTAPSVPTPSPRSAGREEAFFPDEHGSGITARGLHANKFATTGINRVVTRVNPLLDPTVATTTDLSAKETAKVPTDVTYRIYLPPGAAAPLKVTVLFAVGSEILRHGLRSMFESFPNRALVLVPGIEGGWDIAKPVGRAWGVGITASIVQELLAAAGLGGASFTIDVIAGYSTGYRGLAGTINNFATKPSTLDLTGVKNVVIYDALYRGDEPAPGNNTQRALQTIDAATKNAARLVLYEVTGGGTPRNGDTRVAQSWLMSTFGKRYQHTNLKNVSTGLAALIYARMFDAAVKDGYFPKSSLPTSLQSLMDNLPARGDIASTLPLAPFRGAAHTGLSLADWAKTNATDVADLQRHLEPLRKSIIAHPNYLFMGWGVPAVGDIFHDGFIPEFGWEFLLG